MQISDPWEVFKQVGNNGGLSATIVATIEPELLVKPDLPITVDGKQYGFLTASCRFVGTSYKDHKKSQIIASNFIAANGYVSLKATPPSGTLGMIGTLEFLQT